MSESKDNQPRVAVVGAGFGGLACAFELSEAGYHVDVFEARNRLGGRVHTVQDFVPGQHVEFGGELIGKNHVHWQRYAKLFGIELILVEDAEPAPPGTLLVDGKQEQGADLEALEAEIDQGRAELTRLAAGVNWDEPWMTADAERLDNMSTADWMKTLNISDRAKRVFAVELEMDMAVSLEKMNFLALLTTVQAHGGDGFWNDTESFRTKAGNQALASHLAAGIRGRLHLDCPVKRIDTDATGMVIGLADGRKLRYDDVVLAVPPSVWDKIEITPPLPQSVQPQMGIVTKLLTACDKNFWLPRQSPDALTDTVVGMTWEGPSAQENERRSLVAFAGGPVAVKIHALPLAEQIPTLQREFETVMPGYQAAKLKSELVDWPSIAWTRGGYSFPLPGKFLSQSRVIREGVGHLHFAGEHASFGFTGYMEGGLESSVALARRLIKRDQSRT